jgi:hypothetical protein
MAIIEKKIIDKIEILENNFIQVRTASVIEKDGIELTRTFERKLLVPTDNIENEDAKVKSIANSIWTPEVIKEYKDFLIQRQKDELSINKI